MNEYKDYTNNKIYENYDKMHDKQENIRVLVLTDTHLVLKNPKNRYKMIEEGIDLFNKLNEIIKLNDVDIVIHVGDLYDRGYDNVPQTEYVKQIQTMIDMSNLVGGNMFMTLGNHPYSFAKNNPEFLISELLDDKLKEIYKYKETLKLTIPIWKCPGYIDINNVRINFIHYDPQKRYKVENNDKYNIGIYHDDFITFTSKEKLYHHRIGHGIEMLNTDTFDNINTAIIGHIHLPIEPFNLPNSLATDVHIPGALVNRTSSEIHQMVDLPVIDISTTGEILNNYRKLPYAVNKIRYYLPKYEESFNLEVVKDNKEMYEYAKIIKKSKIVSRDNTLFDAFLDELDLSISKLIRNAENLNELESEVLYKEFMDFYRNKRG